MGFVLVGCRLLLAVVLIVAAFGKFRSRARFVETLVAFGTPAGAAGLMSVVIPSCELLVGGLLLPVETARLAGWAAALLLGLFTVAMAANLARGQSPDCACFGSAVSEPIGTATLVRNLVLVGCALLVALTGGPSPADLPGLWASVGPDGQTLVVASTILLVGLVATTVHASAARGALSRARVDLATLERQLTATRRAAAAATASAAAVDFGEQGLPTGVPAPAFDLVQAEGDRASLSSLLAPGRPLLLLFTSAHCSACQPLWPEVGPWQERGASTVTIAVVASGSAQAVELKLMMLPPTARVLLDEDGKVSETFGVTMKPAAVLLDPTGTIATRTVTGVPAIRELVRERVSGDSL